MLDTLDTCKVGTGPSAQIIIINPLLLPFSSIRTKNRRLMTRCEAGIDASQVLVRVETHFLKLSFTAISHAHHSDFLVPLLFNEGRSYRKTTGTPSYYKNVPVTKLRNLKTTNMCPDSSSTIIASIPLFLYSMISTCSPTTLLSSLVDDSDNSRMLETAGRTIFLKT